MIGKLISGIMIILKSIFSAIGSLLVMIKEKLISGFKYLIMAVVVTMFILNIGWIAENLSKASSIKVMKHG
jgi:hypothetical protein